MGANSAANTSCLKPYRLFHRGCLRGCFKSQLSPIQWRPAVLSILWFLQQILIKDTATCALHVPGNQIRDGSGKNILVQVQKVTAPYREVTYSLKIL